MRENDRLRQEVTLLKEELKVFKNRSKLNLDLSRSKSKSINKVDAQRTPKSPISGKKKIGTCPLST